MATKLDLSKEFRGLYLPPKTPVLVEVPPLGFLVIDGHGAPQSGAFQEALKALYNAAYTLKFSTKKRDPALDWRVMPLEALWWVEGVEFFGAQAVDESRKEDWEWRALIAQPDYVTAEMLDGAREELARKKKDVPRLADVHLERIDEGRCAQVMHVGPYDAERPTLERLHAFIAEQGMRISGHHHEIYLGDPRRTAPERLRTVIRYAVERAD
ncbi:MAG TPA: GyrI-like domain-containing protein [Thermoleophilia bacterium]|nr:GyrI-like domain-containing protein [Thermoleophilia bacterium]